MPPVSELDKLAIGQRLEVCVESEWWPTRLEDRQSPAQLTLAWPMDGFRRLIPLQPGTEVEVLAALAGDATYSATAVVDSATHDGVPLVAVTIRGEWQRAQRRSAVRARVAVRPRIANVIQAGNARRPVRLGVVDVSATGVHVRSQDELHRDDLLELAFELDGELQVQARVCRLERRERVWDAGCAFEGIADPVAQRIVQFIFAQQRAMLRARRGNA